MAGEVVEGGFHCGNGVSSLSLLMRFQATASAAMMAVVRTAEKVIANVVIVWRCRRGLDGRSWLHPLHSLEVKARFGGVFAGKRCAGLDCFRILRVKLECIAHLHCGACPLAELPV